MFTSTPVATRRTEFIRRNRSLNRYRSATRAMGPVSLTLTLTLMVGVLALLYLTQITKTSTYGYEVNVLSQTAEELTQRNQELSVEAARLRSIDRIKKSDVAKNLEPEAHVTFSRPDTN